MQGNAIESTRGHGARALLLGAMVLGSMLTHARAQGHSVKDITDQEPPQAEEVAFAVPRGPDGPHAFALPHPLSAADAAGYRRVFALQRAGRFSEAQDVARDLHAPLLMGEVLAQRYTSPLYQPRESELAGWLNTYGADADAPGIITLLSRFPGDQPRDMFPAPLSPDVASAPYRQSTAQPAGAFARNALLDRTIAERAGSGANGVRSALRLIDATPGMTPLYAATLRGEIALDRLSAGDPVLALQVAQKAADQAGGKLGQPAFIAGLAAWRLGQYSDARDLFVRATEATLPDDAVYAAAAYWAARSERRLQHTDLALGWLRKAAGAKATFYGMLSGQALGDHLRRDAPQSVSDREAAHSEVVGEIDIQAVEELPQGQRLFALLQLGERERAEALLRRLWPDIASDAALCHSVQRVAAAAGLTALAEQVAAILSTRENSMADLKGFPMPRLTPRHGFRVDPALVYALTRLESNFDANASSGNGAHGLMQIRPLTASFVTGPKASGTQEAASGVDAEDEMVARLHNPGANLEIGQLYLLYLASLATPNGDGRNDLVHVLAGYNAGPSAIQHWEQSLPREALADPLFFIETLPNGETRDYVRHALTYLWIYAEKLDLPAPSRRRLAHAEWPLFAEEKALRAGATLH